VWLWVGFWLAPRHRQQCRDVMHHGLYAHSDRAEFSQAQQAWSMNAEPPPLVGSMEPRRVLPS
jgi:hypothetical protein